MDPFKQLSAAVPACDQRGCCAYGWHAPAELVGQGPLTETDHSQSSPVKSNKSSLSKPPGFYPLLTRINPAWWELGLTAWIWEVPEEQWQISGGESALSGPDPRRREEEFFLFQREGPFLQLFPCPIRFRVFGLIWSEILKNWQNNPDF